MPFLSAVTKDKNGKYTYKVANVNTVKVGATFAANVPAATANFKAASKTGTTAKLTWTKNANATKYVITYKTGNTSKSVTVDKGTTTTKTLTGLKLGTKYSVSIVAYNGNVKGKTSTISVTTNKAPNKVTGVQKSAVKKTSFKLGWTKNVDAANGYKIVVKQGNKTVKTVTAKASATSAVITGLKGNTKYTVTIVAVNGKKTSAAVSTTVTTAKK